MAQVLKLKRTAVSGKIPTTGNLELGELAMNTYDGRIFLKKDSGTPIVTEILTTNTENFITGSLKLNGAVTASSLNVIGNTIIGGNLTLGGNITIGDQTTDTITVTADFSSSLIPDSGSTYDLGSVSKPWNELHASTLYGDGSNITNITVSSAATVASTFTSQTSITVVHNFNTKNIIVAVYDNQNNQIIPGNVNTSNLDQVVITFPSAQSGYVVVAKGGHIVSGSAEDSNNLNGQPGTYYLNYSNFTNVPAGIVSGSSQITDGSNIVSGSSQIIFNQISSIPSGLVSGSTQITNGSGILSSSNETFSSFSSSVDSRTDLLETFSSSFNTAINLNSSNVTILGDLTVQGTTTTTNTNALNVGDNIIELNYGGSAVNGGLYVKDATGGNTISGSLLWDSTTDRWIAGISGSESTILLSNGDNIISSSAQILNGSTILSSSNENFSTFSSSIDSRVDTLETTFSSSVDSRLDVLEGSFSSSVDSRLDNIELYTSSLDITNAVITGSFTGSFIGDGSGLTGLSVEQVATVTASFSNQSTINVSHNFDTRNVIVSTYDSSYQQLIPQSVTLTDSNTVQIILSVATSGHVVVAKGGHVVSGSASNAYALNGQPDSYYLNFDNHINNPFTQSVNAITASNHIVPSQNVTYDLGSPTHRFRDLYLSNNSIFFEYSTLSVNTGSGFFEFKDANDDPAIIKTETFVLSPSGSTTQTFISAGVQGGVKFLSISDTQMVTYSIDNYDLQQSVTFSYIDSSGNPQSVTVSANTNNYELDAQEGSVTRTSGTDRYRIKLLRVPNDTPTAQIEVASLVVTGSNGGINITISNSGSVEIKNQDDTPANIDAGSITISGSQGQTTLSNELSGGLAVINDAGELQPIRVNQIEIVDSTTGNVINLTSVSGSLTTTATNSSGSTIEPPKSNLSGSFTGSLTLTGDIVSTVDCVKVGTTANPICEIHGTDIFGNIHATNGLISGSDQIYILTTYTEDVSGNSTYTITHNLNEEYPIVQAWNTSSKRQEVPSIIESTSVNSLDVTFSGTFSGRIVVKK